MGTGSEPSPVVLRGATSLRQLPAFRARTALLSDVGLDAAAIAWTMVTEENLPMVRNNCRPSTAEDVRDLAERTVTVWAGLRAMAGAAR